MSPRSSSSFSKMSFPIGPIADSFTGLSLNDLQIVVWKRVSVYDEESDHLVLDSYHILFLIGKKYTFTEAKMHLQAKY
jgi:hypothetical protein